MLKANLTKPRNCPTKSKGVTTQMKALDEYFLVAVFMLLLNRAPVFAKFMFHLNFKKHGGVRVMLSHSHGCRTVCTSNIPWGRVR